MPSAIERLRALASSNEPALSNHARSMFAESGMPVIDRPPPDRLRDTIQTRLELQVSSRNYAKIVALFDELYAARTVTETGYRVYRIAYDHLRSAALPPPSSATSCCPAGLHAVLILARGTADKAASGDDAIICTPDQRCRDLTRRTLLAATPAEHNHWLSHRTKFTLAYADVCAGVSSVMAVESAFAAVQDLDPLEFGIYDDFCAHLMHNGGTLSIDQFADAAAQRTRADFGDLLYARIYDRALDLHDPTQTRVDIERLLAAFEHWLELFPGQPLANRYAAYAHAFGDMPRLEALFKGTLREIHPRCWFTQGQPLAAWRSLSA